MATLAGLGTIFRSSGIVRFVQGGVVKTFRCADSSNPVVDQLRISHEDYLDLVREIHKLPRRRETTCLDCKTSFSYLTLDTYVKCPDCGRQTKTRSFGGYNEPQDVIEAVLAWLGDGPTFDELMQRRNEFFDRELLDESLDDD